MMHNNRNRIYENKREKSSDAAYKGMQPPDPQFRNLI